MKGEIKKHFQVCADGVLFDNPAAAQEHIETNQYSDDNIIIFDVMQGSSSGEVDVVKLAQGSAGGEGAVSHADLESRDAVDAHPISAISGLQTALDAAGSPSALDSYFAIDAANNVITSLSLTAQEIQTFAGPFVENEDVLLQIEKPIVFIKVDTSIAKMRFCLKDKDNIPQTFKAGMEVLIALEPQSDNIVIQDFQVMRADKVSFYSAVEFTGYDPREQKLGPGYTVLKLTFWQDEYVTIHCNGEDPIQRLSSASGVYACAATNSTVYVRHQENILELQEDTYTSIDIRNDFSTSHFMEGTELSLILRDTRTAGSTALNIDSFKVGGVEVSKWYGIDLTSSAELSTGQQEYTMVIKITGDDKINAYVIEAL